jgi:hypothetical protein
MARLDSGISDRPLLVVATGPYVGEGLDWPPLDTLFLAAPISCSGRLVQYAGRILRPWPGKETAEVNVDVDVPILASSLSKRARGYTSLGFPTREGLLHRDSRRSRSCSAPSRRDEPTRGRDRTDRAHRVPGRRCPAVLLAARIRTLPACRRGLHSWPST